MNDDLYLEQIQLGPMENFVYLIGSKGTREVSVVDPAWDIDFLLKHIDLLLRLVIKKTFKINKSF